MTTTPDTTPSGADTLSEEGPPARSPSEQIKIHVTAVVARLQGGYVRVDGGRPTSAAVRDLAQLRRALGSAAGADAHAWAIVLDGIPPTLSGPSSGVVSEPTKAEGAAYTAITTYAVHQQGQPRPVHVKGTSLGEATRQIAYQRARQDSPGGLDEQTVQRLHRVALAHNDSLRAQALRALVTLMRGGQPPVALDYGQLAADLFLLQTQYADSVRLRWGRGLHVPDRADIDDNNQPGDTTDTTTDNDSPDASGETA